MKHLRRVIPILLFACLMLSASIAHAAVTINVAVTTDKATYAQGEVVAINALATYISGGAPVTSVKSAKVTIKNPSGTTVVNGATMTNAGSGNFKYNYALAAAAPAGTWTITAAITDKRNGTGTGNGSFAVTAAPPHSSLVWSGYPSSCRGCHASQFSAMYGALHYQWQSPAPDNTNSTASQGKINTAMNAYCISILGNWTTCGKCHAGRGAQPVQTSNPSAAQLDNIDCLVCHNEAYATARVRLTDGTMGPPAGTARATLDGYVRNITKPTRTMCLKCHAGAGGGDAVKRGDISAVQGTTSDGNLDVHMATTRGNMPCQTCHKFVNHKVTGKGSDLESTDYASEIKCATSSCHPTRVNGGHVTADVNKHIAHVACQTCHVPVYGKVPTEIDRDWATPLHPGLPGHPTTYKNITPVTPTYKWWNRKTWNYLKGSTARWDAVKGAYNMDQLQGGVTGDTTNKLYAFKYKTSKQPMRTTGSIMIALDTNQYLNVNSDYVQSTVNGLFNMGFSTSDAWTTVKTDTYQMLNHTIADAQSAAGTLVCNDCHETTIGGAGSKMALKTMGYAKKADYSVICIQCHGTKTWKGLSHHTRHVTNAGKDCSWCHTFSRPERGLTMP